jgi:glycogen operon protein
MRDRMKRNLLTTLMFSQGVRMLLGGDEFGRSQRGNNNAYCQDNEISWLDWDVDEHGNALADFVRELVAIVADNPILRRRDFLTGEPSAGGPTKDVTWIRPDGQEMVEEDWADSELRNLGMLLLGRAADEVDIRGRSTRGRTLLLLLNAGNRSRSYTLPRVAEPGRWEELINTARPGPWRRSVTTTVALAAHSSLLLRRSELPS